MIHDFVNDLKFLVQGLFLTWVTIWKVDLWANSNGGSIRNAILWNSNIDITSLLYNVSSRGLQLHRGIERVDNTVSVPESWAEFTNNNLKRSQAERAASRDMRNDIQNMLNHASDQLWNQWNKVTLVLGVVSSTYKGFSSAHVRSVCRFLLQLFSR